VNSTVSSVLSSYRYTVALCPPRTSIVFVSFVFGFVAVIFTTPSVTTIESRPESSKYTYPDVPLIPAVIVDVLISKVSSALRCFVTSKNRAPLVSLNSSLLFCLINSARLSFSRVIILVSSRPTEAIPSDPVLNASPDWNLMLSITGFVPPFESSMLTVPSTRRSLIVVAMYLLRAIQIHKKTMAAIINALTAHRTIFFSRDKFLNLSIKTIRYASTNECLDIV